MNIKFRELGNRIAESNIAIEDVANFTELVIAYTISRKLPLPTTLQNNYQEYYTTHYFASVRQELASINEDLVFSVRITAEYVRAFYLIRIAAAYPVNSLFISGANSFFDTVAKVDQYISQANIDLLNRYKKQVLDISVQLSLLLEAQ